MPPNMSSAARMVSGPACKLSSTENVPGARTVAVAKVSLGSTAYALLAAARKIESVRKIERFMDVHSPDDCRCVEYPRTIVERKAEVNVSSLAGTRGNCGESD